MYPGDDSREMYQTLLHHLVLRLNEERDKVADLQRRLDCAHARLQVFEAVSYGQV